MQELLDVVSCLVERIDHHRNLLAHSEACTRSALIEPLLRALGWDTGDPGLVVPEYNIPSKPSHRADYALFTQDRAASGSRLPDVIVEAKKLGEQMDGAAVQAANYCTVDGFEHFAVTDGQRWRVYRTRAQGALNEKLITQFDLVNDGPEQASLRALALWRPAVTRGMIQEAVAPVAAHGGAPAPAPGPQPAVTAAVTEPPTPAATSGVPVPAGADWISLAELQPAPYSKPEELRAPSGETVSVNTWKSLMTEVARWLETQGLLQELSGNIKVGGKFILARSPEHPNGQPFSAPGKADAWFVETSYAAGQLVNHTCTIVRHALADPTQFMVRLRKE